MTPLVSIILLNWNGEKFIYDCIKSINEQTYSNIETIIVDNHSTDGSIEKIEKYNKNFKIIKHSENLGFAKGMNSGIAESLGKYVLLLNYDVYLDRNFIWECVKCAESYPKTAAIGGQAYNWTNSGLTNVKQPSYGYEAIYIRGRGCGVLKDKTEVSGIHGSFPFIRRRALDDIYKLLGEYYDVDFVTAWEDQDLWFRFKLLGWELRACLKARAWHYGSASWQGKKRFSEKPLLTKAQIFRNRYAIAIQNLPVIYLFVLFPCIFLFDLLMVIWCCIFSHSTLKAIFISWKWTARDINIICKKRKILQKHKKVTNRDFLNMFLKKGEK